MASSHYKGANGAIIVFDISRSQTFSNSMGWLNDFRQAAPSDASVLLVGNKADLADLDSAARSVATTSVEEISAQNNITYIETSAAIDRNVTKAFHTLIQSRIRP